MYNDIKRTEKEEEVKLMNDLSLQVFMKKEAQEKYRVLKEKYDDVEASVKMWRSDSYIAESKSKHLQGKLHNVEGMMQKMREVVNTDEEAPHILDTLKVYITDMERYMEAE